VRVPLSPELERLWLLEKSPGPERVTVTRETFRRLPLVIRSWYAMRARGGAPLPSELAVRCLVNDCRRANYRCGGSKSVDGWRVEQEVECGVAA
jgi:hypothetical protein